MHAFAEIIWPVVHQILIGAADRVGRQMPALTRNIASYSNEAFILRGYASFLKHVDGDELAIEVNVQVVDDLITIASDVCAENGRIIAVGPSARIPWDSGCAVSDAQLTDWAEKFEQFLLDSEAVIVDVARELS